MKESTKLWKENGLPHKGWAIESVTELDKGEYSTCDWCHTAIRFIYMLRHPEIEEPTEAGCICTEALCGDYVGPKQAKKDFYAKRSAARKAAAKAQIEKNRAEEAKFKDWSRFMSKGWYENQNGNFSKQVVEGRVTVFLQTNYGYAPDGRRWGWVYNKGYGSQPIFSPEKFHTSSAAKESFYDYLYK